MVPGSLGCGSAVLAATTTLAPSRATLRAIALPMPRDAPVMKNVRPASFLKGRQGYNCDKDNDTGLSGMIFLCEQYFELDIVTIGNYLVRSLSDNRQVESQLLRRVTGCCRGAIDTTCMSSIVEFKVDQVRLN